MAAQQTYVDPGRSAYDDERGAGWITFAGVMIVMVAILNIIDGIAAISNSSFFSNGARYIVFDDLNTWGWIVLGLGVIQLFVAFGVWAGNQLARWTGIVFVSLNAIAQLMFIPAYPFWSLSIFAIDVLVLYALAAYGDRRPSLA